MSDQLTIDPILTRKRAAELLSVCVKTIIRFEESGALPRIQIGQRRVGYRLSAVNKLAIEKTTSLKHSLPKTLSKNDL